MKKTIKLFIAGAFALMPIVACQKEEFAFTSTDGLSFTSTKPILEDETKTAWNGTSIQWSTGDAIRVAYTCNGVWQNASGTATSNEASGSKTAKMYQSTSLSKDAETAQFSVPGDFKGTAKGSYVFYGAYPASACTDGSDFKYAPSLTVTIPITQTPAADSFDSAADFMLGTSVNTYTGIPTEAVSMSWDRMVAHAQLTFKTLNGFTAGETISKVELTADSEADMVGKHYIYLDTKKVTKPSGTVTNALTINGTNISVDETGTFVAWASFLPCTVKSLTVVVTTNKATYTREIASCDLVFKKNARNVLSIKMNEAVRAELTPQPDYSGEWLIVGQNESNYYAAQKWVSGNNLKGLSIKYDGSTVTRVEGIDACKMVITKVEAGTYAGMYTIEDASSTEETKSYLYAASNSSNHLKVHSTLDANSYWTITANEDGSYRIIAEKSSNRNLMRFNYSSATSILFSCYEDKSDATGTNVLLIPYSAIAEDTRTPLTPPSVSAANGTTPNSIDVTWDAVKNAGSYVVTATPATGNAVSETVNAVENTTTYKHTFSGLAYKTKYTISVVAKPSNTTLHLDSAAGEAEPVTTGEKPSTGGVTPTEVTFDFTKISDFSSWTSAYASHTVTYDEGVVTFASANKQTSNITDQPVSKGGALTLVMNNSQTINSLEFTCTQWTTKAQTITLNTSTDGGDTWTKTTNTSSDFVLTVDSLPEGVNAIKFTFSSTSNQIGYKSLKINYNKI
ncbi:MAG: fibronectin type III domain-containing protein [Bacteroidales bacterium]|nr:fibronectin type III domain-containing protein [Bacteroidales bacterium]